MGTINELLAEITKQTVAIAKTRENRDQHFAYRGIDDVYASLHPLYSAAGIITIPSVEDVQTEHLQTKSGNRMTLCTMKVKYTFMAPDGSSIIMGPVVGVGADTSDKYANKALAVAHKYMLTQMHMIPTSDSKDPDAESPEIGNRPQPGPQAATRPTAPAPVPQPQAPRRPAPATTQPASATENTFVGEVTEAMSETKKRDGTPFKSPKFAVKVDGHWYSTFSKTVGEEAMGLKGKVCVITWSQKPDTKFRDLEGIALYREEAPAEDASQSTSAEDLPF